MFKFTCPLLMLLTLLVAAGNPLAADVRYQETIDESSTYRTTRTSGDDGSTVWDETLSGNSAFSSPTKSITYTHSVLGIDPPLIPGGQVRTARLKLYFRHGSKGETELTVDSLDLEDIHRRHFLIGPDPDDSVLVEDSPLADGTIDVHIENSTNTFTLVRSVFDVWYFPSVMTDVESHGSGPARTYELSANYPNPFNPATTIEFELSKRSRVELAVFNMLGQRVKTLMDREVSTGTHKVVWDGTDSEGKVVSSGAYFYRIVADGFVKARKMMLIK